MITAIDLKTMITLEPEIIQEYYDSYKMSNYAPAIIELIQLAKTMPENSAMIAIKNILQNADILPPDDKEAAIRNLKAMGVTTERAIKAVNELKPIKKTQVKSLVGAIQKKIPEEQLEAFGKFLQDLETLHGDPILRP